MISPHVDALGFGQPAEHTVHPVPGRSADLCTGAVGRCGSLARAVAPHFCPDATRDAGNELQSEVFVPRNVAGQAITALRLGSVASFAPKRCSSSEIRTVRGDDLAG